MSWATSLFGSTLLTKEGAKPTSEVVAGSKYVALYFSAHWCPPCRRFTPMFSVLYEDQPGPKEVQVIYVSADNDSEEFEEYFAEMPWAAIPFDNDAKRDELSSKYDVSGIPRVVVLNAADGSVANGNARDVITAKKTLQGIF